MATMSCAAPRPPGTVVHLVRTAGAHVGFEANDPMGGAMLQILGLSSALPAYAQVLARPIAYTY